MRNQRDQCTVLIPGFYSGAEQVPEYGHIREARDTAVGIILLIRVQAAKHADLPVLHTNISFVYRLPDNGLLNASNICGGLYVRDLRFDVQSDIVRSVHTRLNFNFDTYIDLLELGSGVRNGSWSGDGGV